MSEYTRQLEEHIESLNIQLDAIRQDRDSARAELQSMVNVLLESDPGIMFGDVAIYPVTNPDGWIVVTADNRYLTRSLDWTEDGTQAHRWASLKGAYDALDIDRWARDVERIKREHEEGVTR